MHVFCECVCVCVCRVRGAVSDWVQEKAKRAKGREWKKEGKQQQPWRLLSSSYLDLFYSIVIILIFFSIYIQTLKWPEEPGKLLHNSR